MQYSNLALRLKIFKVEIFLKTLVPKPNFIYDSMEVFLKNTVSQNLTKPSYWDRIYKIFVKLHYGQRFFTKIIKQKVENFYSKYPSPRFCN